MLRFVDTGAPDARTAPPTPISTFSFKNEKKGPRSSRRAATTLPSPPSPPTCLPARPPTLHGHTLQNTDFSYRALSSRTTHPGKYCSTKEGRDGETQRLFSIRIPLHLHTQALRKRFGETGALEAAAASFAPCLVEPRSGPSAAAAAELLSARISEPPNSPTTKFARDQAHTLRVKREGGSGALKLAERERENGFPHPFLSHTPKGVLAPDPECRCLWGKKKTKKTHENMKMRVRS